jgi:type II secretory ATPase GspE/PulE/Tfp pilus assembly ATPase PilB-like protein
LRLIPTQPAKSDPMAFSLGLIRKRLEPAPERRESALADVSAELESPELQRLALDRIIAENRLAAAEAERVAAVARETGTTLGAALDRLGLLPQSDFSVILAELAGLDFRRSLPAPDMLEAHPRLAMSFLKARRILPLRDEEGWLFVIADPDDRNALKALRLASGRAPRLAIAPPREIETALAALEERQAAPFAGTGESYLSDAEHLAELANHAPTISFVDGLFDAAIASGATDIHVEPGERSGRVRLRIDGVLSDGGPVPADLYPAVISRLKILAGMDIGERRLPQDGRIGHRGHGKSFDVRAATMPSIGGEAMALRLLRAGAGPLALADLGLPDAIRPRLDAGLRHRNGILLVTGPTGSGKTTTLHAILAALATGKEKIVTVENPVEIRVPGIMQIEARPEIGLTFAAGLRSILRHDPDIIMVGEIRDGETAEIAIQAALTGHLVLSTLHTNDAAASATRLLDMGVDGFLLRATLRLALAQRLVRLLCEACATPAKPTEAEAAYLSRFPAIALRHPAGCEACGRTGFKGRQAIFECAGPESLAQRIEEKSAPARSANGMLDHGLSLVAAGRTTMEEVLRVVDGAGE